MPNLRTPKATKYLLEQYGIKRQPRSLQNLRWRGGGPAYLRDAATGEVLYPTGNLDAWARELLQEARHTAEETARKRRPAHRTELPRTGVILTATSSAE